MIKIKKYNKNKILVEETNRSLHPTSDRSVEKKSRNMQSFLVTAELKPEVSKPKLRSRIRSKSFNAPLRRKEVCTKGNFKKENSCLSLNSNSQKSSSRSSTKLTSSLSQREEEEEDEDEDDAYSARKVSSHSEFAYESSDPIFKLRKEINEWRIYEASTNKIKSMGLEAKNKEDQLHRSSYEHSGEATSTTPTTPRQHEKHLGVGRNFLKQQESSRELSGETENWRNPCCPRVLTGMEDPSDIARCYCQWKELALLKRPGRPESPRHRRSTVSSRARSTSRERCEKRTGDRGDLDDVCPRSSRSAKNPRTDSSARKSLVKQEVADSRRRSPAKTAPISETVAFATRSCESPETKSWVRLNARSVGSSRLVEPEVAPGSGRLPRKPFSKLEANLEADPGTRTPAKRGGGGLPSSPAFSPDTLMALENAAKMLNDAESQMRELSLTAAIGSPTRTDDEARSMAEVDEQLLHIRELIISKLRELNEGGSGGGGCGGGGGGGSSSTSSTSSPTHRRGVNRVIRSTNFRNSEDPIAKLSRPTDSKYQRSNRITSGGCGTTKIGSCIDAAIRTTDLDGCDTSKVPPSNLQIQIGPSVNIDRELKVQNLGNVHISPDISFTQANSNIGTYDFCYKSHRTSGLKLRETLEDEKSEENLEKGCENNRRGDPGEVVRSTESNKFYELFSNSPEEFVANVELESARGEEEAGKRNNGNIEKRTIIPAMTQVSGMKSSRKKVFRETAEVRDRVNSLRTFFTSLKCNANKRYSRQQLKKEAISAEGGIKKRTVIGSLAEKKRAKNEKEIVNKNAKKNCADGREEEEEEEDEDQVGEDRREIPIESGETAGERNLNSQRNCSEDIKTDVGNEESIAENPARDCSQERPSEDSDSSVDANDGEAAGVGAGRKSNDGGESALKLADDNSPLFAWKNFSQQFSRVTEIPSVVGNEQISEKPAREELDKEELDMIDGAVDHFIRKFLFESANEEIRRMSEQPVEGPEKRDSRQTAGDGSSSNDVAFNSKNLIQQKDSISFSDSAKREIRDIRNLRYPPTAGSSIAKNNSSLSKCSERMIKVNADFEKILEKYKLQPKIFLKARQDPRCDDRRNREEFHEINDLEKDIDLCIPRVSELNEVVHFYDKAISRLIRGTERVTRFLSKYEIPEISRNNIATSTSGEAVRHDRTTRERKIAGVPNRGKFERNEGMTRGQIFLEDARVKCPDRSTDDTSSKRNGDFAEWERTSVGDLENQLGSRSSGGKTGKSNYISEGSLSNSLNNCNAESGGSISVINPLPAESRELEISRKTLKSRFLDDSGQMLLASKMTFDSSRSIGVDKSEYSVRLENNINPVFSAEEMQVFRKLMQALKYSDLESYLIKDILGGGEKQMEKNKMTDILKVVATVPPVNHRVSLELENLPDENVEKKQVAEAAAAVGENSTTRSEALESNGSVNSKLSEEREGLSNVEIAGKPVMADSNQRENVTNKVDRGRDSSSLENSEETSKGETRDESLRFATSGSLGGRIKDGIHRGEAPVENNVKSTGHKSHDESETITAERRSTEENSQGLSDEISLKSLAGKIERIEEERDILKNAVDRIMVNMKQQQQQQLSIRESQSDGNKVKLSRATQIIPSEKLSCSQAPDEISQVSPLARNTAVVKSDALATEDSGASSKKSLSQDFQSELSIIDEETLLENSQREKSAKSIKSTETVEKKMAAIDNEVAVIKNSEVTSSARLTSSENSTRERREERDDDDDDDDVAEESPEKSAGSGVILSFAELNSCENSLRDCASLPTSESSLKNDRSNCEVDCSHDVQTRERIMGNLDKYKKVAAEKPNGRLFSIEEYNVTGTICGLAKSSVSTDYSKDSMPINRDCKRSSLDSDSEVDAASGILSEGEIYMLSSGSMSLGEVRIFSKNGSVSCSGSEVVATKSLGEICDNDVSTPSILECRR